MKLGQFFLTGRERLFVKDFGSDRHFTQSFGDGMFQKRKDNETGHKKISFFSGRIHAG